MYTIPMLFNTKTAWGCYFISFYRFYFIQLLSVVFLILK